MEKYPATSLKGSGAGPISVSGLGLLRGQFNYPWRPLLSRDLRDLVIKVL